MDRLVVSLALFTLISSATVTSGNALNDITRTCEPIKIDMCKGLGYNATGMPNLVGHELQQDAQLQFQTFTPLIQYRCSSQLKFFLCSVYVPMCTEKVSQPIGPCRSLCETVKGRCQAVLQEFGFYWPSALNCSKFPPGNNHQHMCMEGPKEDTDYPYPSVTLSGTTSSSVIPSKPSVGRPNNHYGLCYHYKYPEKYYFINRTGRCAHSCQSDILFRREEKEFSAKFTLVISLICFLSALYAIFCFAIETNRIKLPERIIIFISANYLVYALAYFVRLIAGRELVSCHVDSQYGQSILIQEGTDNFYCTIVFVLLYYFSMSAMVWWVILTITWFLGTGLRKSHDEIQRWCSYFHVAAWSLPALKVIAILVMRLVDGDELTGTCFVGNQSRPALLVFVILPSAVYLSLAFLFLLAGLICVVRARAARTTASSQASTSIRMRHASHHSTLSSQMSHPHLLSHTTISSCPTPKDNHDYLNIRVLVFAAFYMLPSACILGANIYEYLNRDKWYQIGSTDRPNVEVFVFKFFMSMIIGMKSGFWVWTRTPWSLWSKLVLRVKKKPIPSYLTTPALVNKQYSIVSTTNTLEKRPQTATLSRHWKGSSVCGGETTV